MKRGELKKDVVIRLGGETVTLPTGTKVKFVRREDFIGWVVTEFRSDVFVSGTRAARFMGRYEIIVPSNSVVHTRGRE